MPKSILKECLLLWFAVVIGISLASRLRAMGLLSGDLLFLVTTGLLLYVPLILYLKRRERMPFLDTSFQEWVKSIALFLIVSTIIFSLALVSNHFYQKWILHFSYQVAASSYSWLGLIGNRLVMAFPEEFFFRGYLQNRMNQALGRNWRFMGAHFGWGLFIVSFLFALSHSLIHFQWWHGLIFFPSLIFGWLKEKRGTLTASILFHTACNVFADWVWFHYR